MSHPNFHRRVISTAVLTAMVATHAASVSAEETLEQRVQRLETQLAATEQKSNSAMEQVRAAAERFNISGYLSAGITASDSDEANYYGIDSDPNTAIDTILGVQMRFTVNEKTEVVAQLNASPDKDSTVSADWAYLSYAASDDITLRAGRLRIPFFAVSDYLEVGYAYPWVRPPAEVYSAGAGFDSMEGADVQWRHGFAGLTGMLQVVYGNARSDLDNNSGKDFELRNMYGANYTLTLDDWSLRTGYYRSSDLGYTPSERIAGLNTGLASLGYQAVDTDDVTASFASVGLTYDNGELLMMSEFIRQYSSGLIQDKETFHVTAGYRFGDLMPYATFAKYYTVDDEQRHKISSGLRATAAAVSDPATVGRLLGMANGLDGMTEQQESYIAGLRYDISAGMAVKVEYMYTTNFGNGEGLYESRPGDGVNTYSIVLDTVF